MVPEGGHGRGRRKVGTAFVQIREADSQEDLISGCFVRNGWWAAAAALLNRGGDKWNQECARGGREPDAGEETANMGDDQCERGQYRRCLLYTSPSPRD